MKRIYAVITVCLSLALCVLASCISREAAQKQMPATAQVSAEENYHTVSFYDGSVVLQQVAVKDGSAPDQYPQGYAWRDASGRTVDPATMVVTRDVSLYTRVSARVRSEHTRYMTATDGYFRPDEDLTRGEAAGIICALLTPETAVEEGGGMFTDMPADSTAAANIRTVSALGIMNGYADGTFRPDASITRSEMLTAMCRLTDTEEVTALAFSDVGADHWSMGSVAAAMAKGWVAGYDDGNFYPDTPITRAEAAVLVNRVIGQTPNRTAIDVVCQQSPYQDVSRWHWAYYDIVDVSFTTELMQYITGEAENMQPGFMLLGDQMCHVNPETLRLDYFAKGFHTVTDGLPSDGVYYVPENGFFVQRNQPGLQEFDGSLFYVLAQDGPFASNYDLGYLHFGENGRYTSGDAAIDGYVDEIMAPIIQGKTENLLKESNLRQAFDYVSRYGGYRYLSRPMGWHRGTTSWTTLCARMMFETKRGPCYFWAAAFLYLARRLGYQAYPICGGVGTANTLHAWVMIDDADGTEYIYDAELDWAYRTNYYHNGTGPMDMFKQRRGHANVVYVFPGDTYYAPPNDNEELLGDSPEIIWPTTVFDPAYVMIDGELVAMDTTWDPLLDESGATIGYLVTATYGGQSFTYQYMLSEETDPNATPGPGDIEATASPEPTDTPGGSEATASPAPTDTPGESEATASPEPTDEPGESEATAAPEATEQAETTEQPKATTEPVTTTDAPTTESGTEPGTSDGE